MPPESRGYPLKYILQIYTGSGDRPAHRPEEILRTIREAAGRLRPGGAMYIVIRRQQGAESALKELRGFFESAEPIEKKSGFWVIACRGPKPAERMEDL